MTTKDPTKQVAVRLPESLLKALRSRQARMKKQIVGIDISLSDVIRTILTEHVK